MLPPRKMIFNTRPSNADDDDIVVEKRARSAAIEVHSAPPKPTRLGIAISKSEHWMVRERAVALKMTINDYCRMKLLAPDDE